MFLRTVTCRGARLYPPKRHNRNHTQRTTLLGVVLHLCLQGLTTTDVHYYLAFMLRDRDTMAVAFQVRTSCHCMRPPAPCVLGH